MPSPAKPLHLLAAALLLAGCPAEAPVAPAATEPPARRLATPRPTAAPSFGPTLGPDAEGVRTIDHMSPWVKREGAGAVFTFQCFEKDEATVFFRLKTGLRIQYAFRAEQGGDPIAQGTVELKETAQKFDMPATGGLPDRLRCTYVAALPDRRTLEGESVLTVQ